MAEMHPGLRLACAWKTRKGAPNHLNASEHWLPNVEAADRLASVFNDVASRAKSPGGGKAGDESQRFCPGRDRSHAIFGIARRRLEHDAQRR
jgi:hypothetical protein